MYPSRYCVVPRGISRRAGHAQQVFQQVQPEEEEDDTPYDDFQIQRSIPDCPCEECPETKRGTEVPPAPSGTPEETKTQTDDGMTCPICQEILKAPMLSPCGHSVCQGCLEEMVRKDISKCPSGCGKGVNHLFFYPNFSLSKAIAAKYPQKPQVPHKPDVWTEAATASITAAKLAERSADSEAVILKGILRSLMHSANQGVTRGERFVTLNDRQMVEINQHPLIKPELEKLGYKLLVVSNTVPPRMNMFLTW